MSPAHCMTCGADFASDDVPPSSMCGEDAALCYEPFGGDHAETDEYSNVETQRAMLAFDSTTGTEQRLRADLAAAGASVCAAAEQLCLPNSLMFERARAEARAVAAPCSDCGTSRRARSACPLCGKVFCRRCAEKPGEFCCEGMPTR